MIRPRLVIYQIVSVKKNGGKMTVSVSIIKSNIKTFIDDTENKNIFRRP